MRVNADQVWGLPIASIEKALGIDWSQYIHIIAREGQTRLALPDHLTLCNRAFTPEYDTILSNQHYFL